MKDNGYILKTFDVFMTKNDEYDFSVILKQEFNNLSFVSYKTSKDKARKEFEYLSDADTGYLTIVNNNIIDIEEYNSIVVERNSFYYFPMVGEGIIQFDLSEQSEYHKNCLQNGRIAISYELDDTETSEFVKQVLKIIRQRGKHVYRINENGVFEKPERNACAWSDAVKQFNGSDERFLSFGYNILAIAK
jgi:hypothetical protein